MAGMRNIFILMAAVSVPTALAADEDSRREKLFDRSLQNPAHISAPVDTIVISQKRDEACIQGCKDNHRDEVKLCNTLYPPKHRIQDHKQCLANARATYDACLAPCR